jgi:hypothetical protein
MRSPGFYPSLRHQWNRTLQLPLQVTEKAGGPDTLRGLRRLWVYFTCLQGPELSVGFGSGRQHLHVAEPVPSSRTKQFSGKCGPSWARPLTCTLSLFRCSQARALPQASPAPLSRPAVQVSWFRPSSQHRWAGNAGDRGGSTSGPAGDRGGSTSGPAGDRGGSTSGPAVRSWLGNTAAFWASGNSAGKYGRRYLPTPSDHSQPHSCSSQRSRVVPAQGFHVQGLKRPRERKADCDPFPNLLHLGQHLTPPPTLRGRPSESAFPCFFSLPDITSQTAKAVPSIPQEKQQRPSASKRGRSGPPAPP